MWPSSPMIGEKSDQNFQSEKAEKLVAALGILARAQELGAGEDDIWVLTAGVQQAEREFRADYRTFR
jgi:hypothetical protein